MPLAHLAGHVRGLGDVLELEVVTLLCVQRDAGLHRAQRSRRGTCLRGGRFGSDLLCLHRKTYRTV